MTILACRENLKSFWEVCYLVFSCYLVTEIREYAEYNYYLKENNRVIERLLEEERGRP